MFFFSIKFILDGKVECDGGVNKLPFLIVADHIAPYFEHVLLVSSCPRLKNERMYGLISEEEKTVRIIS